MKKAFFIGCNALGDTLCTTPALRAFRKANPDIFVSYVVQNATYCRALDGNRTLIWCSTTSTCGCMGWRGLPSSGSIPFP
jgi:hypothetical protein